VLAQLLDGQTGRRQLVVEGGGDVAVKEMLAEAKRVARSKMIATSERDSYKGFTTGCLSCAQVAVSARGFSEEPRPSRSQQVAAGSRRSAWDALGLANMST